MNYYQPRPIPFLFSHSVYAYNRNNTNRLISFFHDFSISHNARYVSLTITALSVQLSLHRFHQRIPGHFLPVQSFHDLLISGSLGYDIPDHQCIAFLSLPPERLVEFRYHLRQLLHRQDEPLQFPPADAIGGYVGCDLFVLGLLRRLKERGL